MIEVSTTDLKSAIESQHGGTATQAQSVPVRGLSRRWSIASGRIAAR